MGILAPARARPSGDEFPPFASAEPIRTAGEAMQAAAGDVENLSLAVDRSHAPAQEGVAGLLSDPMRNAPQPMRDRALDWLQTSLVAGGAVSLFGDAVDAYNDGVAALSTEWNRAKGNNFGLSPPENTDDEQGLRDYLADYDGRADAKLVALRSREQALWSELDAAANRTALLLTTEPSAVALVELYEAGVLPIAAPAVFPGVDFSAVDAVAMFENLRDRGVIPAFFFDWERSDDILPYLLDHPEVVPAVAMLLRVPDASDQYYEIFWALKEHDVRVFQDGIAEEDRSVIGRGIERLEEINARLAAGGTFTPTELEYVQYWVDGTRDDVLLLPGIVERSVGPSIPENLLAARTAEYVSPVADALVNLADPAKTGLSPNDVSLGRSAPSLIYDDGDAAVAAREIGRYADLLAAATVPGDPAAWAEAARDVLWDRLTLDEDVVDEFDHISDDEQRRAEAAIPVYDPAVSRMLTVVAEHSPDAAARFLVSDDEILDEGTDLQRLLTTEWTDDAGAVAIIRSGTDSVGGADTVQAEAARVVIRELQPDDAFGVAAYNMTPAVADAVADVGRRWADDPSVRLAMELYGFEWFDADDARRFDD